MAAQRLERQNLIIDADDTLWENNIYFEQAFDRFCEFLAHSHMSPEEVRAVLDEIEIVNNQVHGYGTGTFGRNLSECYRHLAQKEIREEDINQVMSFARSIVEQPIEVMDGVEETLIYLSERHDLTLFTKGNYEEQKLKLDRSGLAPFFGHTAVVKEKNTAAYQDLLVERNLDPRKTWMAGNSPKSDINPALAAGLNAIFIPHPHTWRLEFATLTNGGPGKMLELQRFSDLRSYF